MDIQSKQILPPPFTLYPLTTQDLKTCYQSQKYKIICSLNGPYFDRKHSDLQPLFNVTIGSSQQTSAGLTSENIVRLQKKIEEVLQTLMIAGRYERMVFDIVFQVIENNANNPTSFLLSPLLNLLSFTCALRCLETTSSFACTALLLRQQQLLWQTTSPEEQPTDRSLVLCSDSRDRKALMTIFNGEFSYVEFQKLAGAAQDTNQQLLRFQQEKVNEVYQLFHQ